MEPAPGAALAAKIATVEPAGELVARAEREGIQLVGRGGLLRGLTKTVLESNRRWRRDDRAGGI